MRRSLSTFKLLLVSASFLAISSAAFAQDLVCDASADLGESGPSLECVNLDAGLLALVTRRTTQTVNVEVRDYEGLWCEVEGEDELGRFIGRISVTAEDGSVEDCFRDESGNCFETSPVGLVTIMCWVPDDVSL